MTDNGGTQERPTRAARTVHRIHVEVVAGPDAGLTAEPDRDRSLAIGLSPDNDVVLSDPTVSRYHLEIAADEQGLTICDLGSLNGTWLGDVRIERALVPPGTRLRLGNTAILVRERAEDRPVEGASLPATFGIVGESEAMREVANAVSRLAPLAVSVLIQGETGTGKELVARAIHDHGPRRDAPFVVVDCGSLPETLVASELFGHEKGAFTGADRRRDGAFVRADGGTVFLDEIGELPLPIQPALLGVLERRRFRRIGGDRDIDVDVRVVAATHRDLRSEVNRGRFRADLYYRLAVARVAIAPLRQRVEDVPLLVKHFVEEIAGSGEAAPFDAATLADLRDQHWAGNVRELRNVVEAALAMGQVDLDGGAAPAIAQQSAKPSAELPTYRDARAAALAEFESSYLRKLIDACDGNASEAARRAKMDRVYLLSLLRRRGLR